MCITEVEAQAGKQGWATFMLPSPSEEAQYADAYPPAEPDYTALQPAALLARDEEIVSDMLAEVRTVIGTAKFHAALRVRPQVPSSIMTVFETLIWHLNYQLSWWG